MHYKWWRRIASLIAFVLSGPALAQSCAEIEADGFNDRSVSEQLSTHSRCLLEQQQQIDEIQSILGGLDERTRVNLSTIELWEKERLPVLEAAADQQQAIDAIQLILGDSVLAFDRSQRTGACPRGWSLFEPAGGRMIVGAGRHSNGHTEYPAFKDKPKEATGGAEEVTLTEAQMPAHNHGGALMIPDGTLYGMNNDNRFHNSGAGVTLHASGGNRPHENMPPYIALYFCKKD